MLQAATVVALSLHAALLLRSAPVSATVSPCAPGWAYFPDLANREFVASLPNGAGVKNFGGSCLRIIPGSDLPSPYRQFGEGAEFHCELLVSGSHLASVSSLVRGREDEALLSALKGLMALPPAPGKPPRTPVVLVGGTQNPAATGPTYAKNGNWVWVDKFTNPASITTPAKTNWVPGQPE